MFYYGIIQPGTSCMNHMETDFVINIYPFVQGIQNIVDKVGQSVTTRSLGFVILCLHIHAECQQDVCPDFLTVL